MDLKKEILDKLLVEPFEKVVGQESVKLEVKSAIVMNRPLILVGPPGLGKTTFARSIAKILSDRVVNDCGFNCNPDAPVCPYCLELHKEGKPIQTKSVNPEDLFIRVQGSPDLTAEDLIGDIDPIKAMKYGAMSVEAFTPGKIFQANNGILFFDEVNRCSEKLQNALLQVLEERKVTVGSYNFQFESNFIFIGTMNPDDTSTEPLSDVFLDRFDLIYVDYPETKEQEVQIVRENSANLVKYSSEILNNIVAFIRNLRENKNLEKKPSVRSTIGILERAQSTALIRGKKSVDMDDVRDVISSVLNHRIRLKPSLKYTMSVEQFLNSELDEFMESTQST